MLFSGYFCKFQAHNQNLGKCFGTILGNQFDRV